MFVVPVTVTSSVAEWMASFGDALAAGNKVGLERLFHSESHWRDVLALTWRIGTVSGAKALAAALATHAGRIKPQGFEIDPKRTPPREVTRAGAKCIEAIFRFETEAGRGSGVVRLREGKAWTLLTALDELKGHEERT